jgi:DNA (cytosine-5)-methyltransferase 1
MADGSASQSTFNFPKTTTVSRLRPGEIVVDLFAGGGGASLALEAALLRPVDIACNHDEICVASHAANHPLSRHLCADVWEADPRVECGKRPVGWLHASPECTHFSVARAGQPRSRASRALSWVVLRWAGTVRPRIISLENVKQIVTWTSLCAKRDPNTGRVVKVDGSVAAPGERVPVEQQFLVPDKKRIGRTWNHFVSALRRLGYAVEWRMLKACDYGAGTSRTRLFLIARCDGEPICWPEPTHGPGRAQPYVTAADCIDWSIPCPSIFTRKKPLADATMRRIARGMKRYVIDAAEPFIVQCAHASASGLAAASAPLGTVTAWPKGGAHAVVSPSLMPLTHQGSDRVNDALQPLPTITAAHRGELAMAAATLVQTGYGERDGQAPRVPGLDKPLGTLVDGQKHAAVTAHLIKFRGDSQGCAADHPLPTITSGAGATRPAGCAHALGVVTAYLEQAAGGPNSNCSRPRGADEPVSTISTRGSQQQLITANLVTLRGDNVGAAASDPLRTLSAGGEHHAVVEYTLSPEHEAGALKVAAFLMRYYSQGGQWGEVNKPLDTITTRERLALVTVTIQGTPYVIVDIGLRMLTRKELFKAQGFPAEYIIDRTADGRILSISRSVALVGNSVSPPPMVAVVRANLPSVPIEVRHAA